MILRMARRATRSPRECILGPVLWNAAYDGVLRLKLPPGVKLVGFADEITTDNRCLC